MTGFLIAGTSSGVGKTTVTLAIIAAFRRRGLVVQPFKGGPDFLDTGHQTLAAGRTARNLDTWMLDEQSNREVLQAGARGADVVVVEGMMGLFDGKDGATDAGSSAEIARLLHLPVVLVLDAGKSARSIAATVLGFELFDPELKLAGVILNRVASEGHYRMLQAAIHSRCSTPLLGWFPREAAIAIPERHLGLQTAEEQSAAANIERLATLAELAEARLDLDALLALQCGIDFEKSAELTAPFEPRVRIGVARDEAFSFYYEDNFDLLREAGAEIVPFSPMRDSALPPNLDALYLGGGYPELHARALSENGTMLQAMRDYAMSGRPVYAECGGMIYLGESLRLKDGSAVVFARILPLRFEMTERLVQFGYVTVELLSDCLAGPAGTTVRGHSFHHSRIAPHVDLSAIPKVYGVTYSLSGNHEIEGFGMEGLRVLASYIHVHFRTHRDVAANFVEAALAARKNALVTA
jgi:cobyrinic acid a,c-diamide synthase